MKAIEILEKTYKLPVRSAVQTMQRVGEWSLNTKQWHDISKELRGDTSNNVSGLDGEHEQEYATKYFIQNIIKQYTGQGETKFDVEALYLHSVEEAKKYIASAPWVFAKAEGEEKLNSDGSPASKKGDKKLLAKQVYEANKDKEMSRKQWIELLVKEVDLTPAGASTYYANLKKGKY
jgi:hypothetical protein